MRASEIMEQLITIQQQARALVGQTNALIRAIHPMVEEEEQEEQDEPQMPRVFGGKNG